MTATEQLRKSTPAKPLVLDWWLDGRNIHWIVEKLAHMEVINCDKLTPNERLEFVEDLIREQLKRRHLLWLEMLKDTHEDIKGSIAMMEKHGTRV